MTIAQIDIPNRSVAVKKVVHVYQYTCCTIGKNWYICKSNKSLGNSLAYLNLCCLCYAVRCPMPKEDHFSFVTLQNARAGFICGCFLAGRCWSSELLKLTSWKSSQSRRDPNCCIFSELNPELINSHNPPPLCPYALNYYMLYILQKLYGYCLIRS